MYYIRNVEGDVISNISDNYSETVEMYVDALAEDKCHNIYHVQFYIPYADFTGSFDLAMGDSQTTHGFEATSLASACTNLTSSVDTIASGACTTDVFCLAT